MQTLRRFPLLAVVLAGAGVLAACAPASDADTSSTASPTTVAPSSPAPSTSAPAADAAASGILGIELGSAFDEAVAETGAVPEEACPGVATMDSGEYRLQLSSAEDASSEGATIDTVSVTVPVGNAAAGDVGPRTAEGIGVGSTLDEARAAYPEAQEVGAADGPIQYLEIESDPEGGALYLLSSDGAPVIWGLVATTLPEPTGELCG